MQSTEQDKLFIVDSSSSIPLSTASTRFSTAALMSRVTMRASCMQANRASDVPIAWCWVWGIVGRVEAGALICRFALRSAASLLDEGRLASARRPSAVSNGQQTGATRGGEERTGLGVAWLVSAGKRWPTVLAAATKRWKPVHPLGFFEHPRTQKAPRDVPSLAGTPRLLEP